VISLSLLEAEEHDAILLSKKKDLIQKILEFLSTFDSLTSTYWSIITTSCSFRSYTRQGRVLPTPGQLMKMSHCIEDDSIESTLDSESGVLQSFGFNLVLF